jgi:GT2 family glycosyltransferase
MTNDPGDLDLTIIVVSFNTREMTIKCLRSVIAQTIETSYEIIVVDNHSDDGSAEAIEAQFPNIVLVRSKRNIGFARANNLAAKKARGRRLLLLNPDTVILDHAIDHLVNFANENASCRIWGGRTLSQDGSLNPRSCWRKMTLWNEFCYALGLNRLAPNSAILSSASYGGWDRSTVRHVDIVSGCFLLIDRELWRQLAGFDLTFFMYAEDADLCMRALQSGARPLITPAATIIHYGGASERSRADKLIKLFKGKITLMYRHWSPFKRSLGRTLMLTAPLIRWHALWFLAWTCRQRDFNVVANEWRKVWVRRSEWISGYIKVSRLSSTSQSAAVDAMTKREMTLGDG